MISEVDSDGDASVDQEEFLIMMAKQMKQADDEAKLRRAFQLFDKVRIYAFACSGAGVGG